MTHTRVCERMPGVRGTFWWQHRIGFWKFHAVSGRSVGNVWPSCGVWKRAYCDWSITWLALPSRLGVLEVTVRRRSPRGSVRSRNLVSWVGMSSSRGLVNTAPVDLGRRSCPRRQSLALALPKGRGEGPWGDSPLPSTSDTRVNRVGWWLLRATGHRIRAIGATQICRKNEELLLA
jgi:hypothetical protein